MAITEVGAHTRVFARRKCRCGRCKQREFGSTAFAARINAGASGLWMFAVAANANEVVRNTNADGKGARASKALLFAFVAPQLVDEMAADSVVSPHMRLSRPHSCSERPHLHLPQPQTSIGRTHLH